MAVAERVSERVGRLRASLEEPLLVTTGVNVRYLIGFESSNAAVYVDDERLVLFTDFRYAEAARALDGVEFVQSQRSLLKTVGATLDGRIAFEASALTYDGWETLGNAGLELVPRKGLVEELRAVKDESELETIREAARITDQAYAAFAEERFVGRTEHDLAWRLEQIFHELGRTGPPSRASSAPGLRARCHTAATDRVVEPNTTVVVDTGAVLEGYNSDCTRTFATGDLPDDLAQAYDACLRGQLAGLDAMRAGVLGADADAAARNVIEDAGFSAKIGHGRPRRRPARPRGAGGAARVRGRARARQRHHV
jgi:Xaa-Pro aminopeptidase